MSNLVSLKKMRELQEKYSDIAQSVNSMSMKELQIFRIELIKTLRNLDIWEATLKSRQRQLLDDDRSFLRTFHDEVDRLELEVSNLIEEKEQTYALHEQWEADLLPEPVIGKRITPKYPALAGFACDNLISLMDDSWLPVARPDNVKPLNLGVSR